MKKKVSVAVLAVVFTLLCAFGLTACGEKEPPKPHVHNYVWAGNGDSTHEQLCIINRARTAERRVRIRSSTER